MSDENTEAKKDAGKGQFNSPLFYENVTALDASRHEEFGLIDDFGLSFTAGVNSVPVNMVEMLQVCHTYPITFGPGEDAPLIAILGIRDNENLFVDNEGGWESNIYIPAYIRRYPFIFSEIPGDDKLTLCVDLKDNVTSEKAGRKFFDDKGKPTELTKKAIEFCKSYHAAALQTLEFSRAINDAGLLVKRIAEIDVGEGKLINFSGFRIIDEARLEQVPDSTFIEWRKKGWLPFLYAHLLSGTQWEGLARRLGQRIMENNEQIKSKAILICAE